MDLYEVQYLQVTFISVIHRHASDFVNSTCLLRYHGQEYLTIRCRGFYAYKYE